MTDPYRASQLTCPACASGPLREFQGRYCCDGCSGMLLSLEQLGQAIEEICGEVPVLASVDERPGQRRCPRCTQPMLAGKLNAKLFGKLAKAKAALDRCPTHGIWFDGDELAAVLESARAKVPRGGS